MVQFDLLPRPPGLPTGDLELWFIPHPLARRRRQFSEPRAPDRPHIRFLRVHPFECNTDFRTMAKRDVFRTFIKVSRVH